MCRLRRDCNVSSSTYLASEAGIAVVGRKYNLETHSSKVELCLAPSLKA